MTAQGFPVRHMNFDFPGREYDRYPYDNNAFASMWFVAFSIVIIYGETLVIDGARESRGQITDPKLRADIAALIGQEAMHSRSHKEFNAVTRAQGYPVDRIDRQVAAIERLLAAMPHKLRLSLMAAVEHMTGVWSQEMLENPDHEARMSPYLRDVMMWHALEENEHKSVTFDMFKALSDNYALRISTLPFAAWAVVFGSMTLELQLLHADGSLWKPRNLREHVKGFFALVGPHGVFNTRRLGQMLDYFRPSFHPNDHDTRELLKRTRERLLAGDGYLAPQVTKIMRPKG